MLKFLCKNFIKKMMYHHHYPVMELSKKLFISLLNFFIQASKKTIIEIMKL